MNLSPGKIVLVGMESVGKSAVFRCLTGAYGDEVNVRGSTVHCREAADPNGQAVVDTPGLRLDADTEAARLALASLDEASRVVVVARAIDGRWGVDEILRRLRSSIANKPVAVILTFSDREREAEELASQLAAELKIGTTSIDARRGGRIARERANTAIAAASLLRKRLPLVHPIEPAPSRTSRREACLAILALIAMFGAPVWMAYKLSQWLQPIVDEVFVMPLVAAITGAAWPPMLQDLLVGPFGLLTLGVYSIVWALPLIGLLGAAVALVDDSGLKDRIVDRMDPLVRRFGLQGRDLIPILGGFGCNAVAIQQSRSCSSCTREACAATISIGSSCSYQLGAALSIFTATGRPTHAIALIALVFVVGLVHVRVWYGRRPSQPFQVIARQAILQAPSWRAVTWRMAGAIKQFLTQALPVFLGVCVVGALLSSAGILSSIADGIGPILGVFDLPGDAAPSFLTSIVRKDGLLLAHENGGAMLTNMTASQIFLLVYLSCTATGCLVTLWTMSREFGRRATARIAFAQLVTSLVSAFVLARLLAFGAS